MLPNWRIFAQMKLSFSRTYVRTLTKLSVFGPSEILLANSGNVPSTAGNNLSDIQGGGGAAATANSDTKLHQEIADEFPSTCIVTIHRKYFKDTKVSLLFVLHFMCG